jgi:hypothetical protein
MGKRTQVPPGKQKITVARGIYRKKNGKYLAQFRDPGRKQHWAEFRTLKEAQAWRARGLSDPRSLTNGKRTLGEVWSDFWRHHGSGLRPTTRANWLQEWTKYVGIRRPAIIKPTLV